MTIVLTIQENKEIVVEVKEGSVMADYVFVAVQGGAVMENPVVTRLQMKAMILRMYRLQNSTWLHLVKTTFFLLSFYNYTR